MSRGTCDEHQSIAISCSKIDEIHNTLKTVNTKVDLLTVQLSTLSTQKSERWRVQGWLNKGLIGLMVTVIVAFKVFGGK